MNHLFVCIFDASFHLFVFLSDIKCTSALDTFLEMGTEAKMVNLITQKLTIFFNSTAATNISVPKNPCLYLKEQQFFFVMQTERSIFL